MENDKMIGQRIQNRRNELNLGFNQVCEITKISKGNLSGIENSKYLPSSKALIELSKVLNCSIDWMLTGNNLDSQTEVSISELPTITEINGTPVTQDEINLIENYRKLTDSNKLALKDFCKYKLYDQGQSAGLSSTSRSGKEPMEEHSEIA